MHAFKQRNAGESIIFEKTEFLRYLRGGAAQSWKVLQLGDRLIRRTKRVSSISSRNDQRHQGLRLPRRAGDSDHREHGIRARAGRQVANVTINM